MGKYIDMTGKKIGRLTVLSRVENMGGQAAFLCRCDCGKETIVTGQHMRSGHTKSCGCYSKEMFSLRVRSCDGDFGTRLQRIWKNMKDRCDKKYCSSYIYYGNRGIKVCKEWYDYSKFKQWALSHNYKDGLTIDRIDNNGNYCPENCRWVDMKTQCNNNRHNRFVTINNRTQTIQQWCDEYGIKRGTVNLRVVRGYSLIDAITKPIRKNRRWHNEN